MMTLSIIVAMANNHAIGKDNRLLWRLPEDLRYFKRITIGKPVVMGRKTFESIGRPLPERTNIVITRQTGWQHEGVEVAHTVDSALAAARLLIAEGDEVMVIGGAEIYREVLPKADKLYLTRVNVSLDGDAFFPELNFAQWQKIRQDDFFMADGHPYDYSFCVFERV